MKDFGAQTSEILHDLAMEWVQVAEVQAGAVSLEQLVDAGVDERSVTRMTQLGLLVRRAAGVFTVRGAPLTYLTELWIAVLSTSGLIGFATAAHLWEMAPRPARIDVIVGTQRRVKPEPGVRRHHVFVPAAEHTTVEGLPITSRRWTVLDHVGRLPRGRAIQTADRALQQGWLSRRDIARRVAEYPGRQGNVRLREILDLTSGGAAAESERRLHALLRQARIPGWEPNYAVRVTGRIVARIDVAIATARLAIEVDGMAHHTDVDRFQRDRQRQNLLTSLGWTVLRFTWFDLVERPHYVLDTIRAHLPRS